ncbi:Uncharacterised protein [Vibrio harveyi]|nr:Uncharacterised protein [Vibrio harveyi]
MPKIIEVPCEKCEETKREIEEDNLWIVLSCEPIEDKPGWCKLEYDLK